MLFLCCKQKNKRTYPSIFLLRFKSYLNVTYRHETASSHRPLDIKVSNWPQHYFFCFVYSLLGSKSIYVLGTCHPLIEFEEPDGTHKHAEGQLGTWNLRDICVLKPIRKICKCRSERLYLLMNTSFF